MALAFSHYVHTVHTTEYVPHSSISVVELIMPCIFRTEYVLYISCHMNDFLLHNFCTEVVGDPRTLSAKPWVGYHYRVQSKCDTPL